MSKASDGGPEQVDLFAGFDSPAPAPAAEPAGMPKPRKVLKVHFETDADLEAFSDLIGQRVTRETRAA